ncbi:MAG TPA: TonB-dependent receptor plug domain-containing protein [Opitutaceae bacterium]|nr:TonB-dependent receptor plug domain-containing protein [Opitutaceae bacterium]
MMSVTFPSRERRLARVLVPCLALIALPSAPGQTPAGTPADREEEVVQLSPFEVNSEQDTGYLASTAQSGTRLRTDLKDIASSISVVTKDFMNDIGAKDLETLLVYTLGTEVGGVGGNFSDAGTVNNPNGAEVDYDAAFASAAPSTRVRGLTSADLSRDFFISGLPMDGYNVDRVEISRGPNAMLFGLGSPSGIINSSLIAARMNRNRTELELRTDQYGSFRSTLDHNQVLIKDKFALRFAAVYEDQSYKVEEAWRRNKRAFLTGTYRPFHNTTLKASAERGNVDSNLPETRPPYDVYTQWFLMGRPAWNPSNATGTLLGTPAPGWPTTVFTSAGLPASTGGVAFDGSTTLNSGNLFGGQVGAMGNGSRQMVTVFNDPNSSSPSLGLPGSTAQGYRNGNYERLFRQPNGTFAAATNTAQRGVRDWNYILNRVLHYNDPTYNYWRNQQITDPAYFNFYEHMLHGPNKHEWADFEAYNVSLEQRFLEGKGGAELSVYHELLANGNTTSLDSTISGYALRVDMNSHLGNGQVNPNFGRPFVVGYSRANVRDYSKGAVRGTVYYDLDLRDQGSPWLGKLLGRHRLTATYTELDNKTFLSNNNFAQISGTDYQMAEFGAVNSAGGANRASPIVRYLGPSVAGSATPVTGIVSAPTTQSVRDLESVNILYYNTPPASSTVPGTWSERTFSLLRAGEKDVRDVIRNASRTREKIDSLVGVAQSYWWDGTLVSTLGWRKDQVRTYDAGTVQINTATGLAILDGFEPLPVADETHTSFNYGLVLHAPAVVTRRLPESTTFSLIYNQADNFRPAQQRYDIYDRALPGETGETKEYGISLSTLNGKFVFRAMRYETTSALSSSLLTSLTTPLNNLVSLIDNLQTENLRGTNASRPAGVAAWNEWFDGPVGSALRGTFRIRQTTLTNGQPDILSENRSGEVVSTADVVSKGEEFEAIFNPTPQWRIAFNANRAEAVRNRVATELYDVVFNSFVPLMAGSAGDLIPSSSNATFDARSRFRQQVYVQMLPELLSQGAPTPELREWRFNAITNYTFNRGRLKGLNVGGGVRWQDEVAIAYPIINDPVLGAVPDVANPYHDKALTDFDAWIGYTRRFDQFTFKVQLNVKNIGVGDELVAAGPNAAQPDGTIATWRIREPQFITLRTTFTF